MAENQIRISRRLSLPALALAWLTVFAIPVVLLQLSLEYLFELTMQANQQAATSTLTSEMSSFRRELETEAFVARRLNSFFAGGIQPGLTPAGLMKLFNEKSGLTAAGVITHTADTLEVDSLLDARLQKELQTLPRAVMRRYLVAVNRQYQHEFCDSRARPVIENIYRYVDYQKVRKDADSVFRRQFGLIAEIPLQPDRVCRSVSSKLGGSAYFYYHPFTVTGGGKTSIRGGCLLILRGADINLRRVWQEAVAMSVRGVKRSFARLATRLDGDRYLTREIITRFSSDGDGFHLIAPLSDHALVDLIQVGTFVPFKLDAVLQKLPLLKVTIPIHDLQHPLAPWAGKINFLARLFALAGAVLMLRLFFYGIDFRLGIRAKVLSGTAVMLLLPIMLLLAGLVTWGQFNRVYAWYQAEELQRQFFNELYDGFGNYLTVLQKQSLDVAAAVAAARDRNESLIPEVLRTGLASSTASEVYLDLHNGGKMHFKSQRYYMPVSQEEESGRRLITGTILNGFDAHGRFIELYSGGKERVAGSVDASFVNETINRWGKPFKLVRINTDNRFSTVFVHNRDKFSPYGLLSFKYFDVTLIREFILRHFRPSARFAGVAAHFYLAEKEGPGYRLTGLHDGRPLKTPSLLEKVSLAEEVESFLWRERGADLRQIRWFNDFPLVMIVGSAVFAGGVSGYLMPALLAGYGLLLLLFIFMVFELIYLRPLREFIRVTGEVGNGSYDGAVQLNANDEFGDLKTVFTGMIQGLEQRRKLAHFVSQDVLTAVESGVEDALEPGGVRVAATVVFVQLQSSVDAGEDDADAIFSALGRFIATGDRIANSCGGVIDKVIDNTLMLVFRAATAGDNHSLQACRAALQIAAEQRAAGLAVKAGISSGNVVSGRIGSRLGKLDYTVIGDTVNLAARLKAEAARAGVTGIIVAPSTIRGLRGQARVAFIDRTEIRGKSREYPLYELLELR